MQQSSLRSHAIVCDYLKTTLLRSSAICDPRSAIFCDHMETSLNPSFSRLTSLALHRPAKSTPKYRKGTLTLVRNSSKMDVVRAQHGMVANTLQSCSFVFPSSPGCQVVVSTIPPLRSPFLLATPECGF